MKKPSSTIVTRMSLEEALDVASKSEYASLPSYRKFSISTLMVIPFGSLASDVNGNAAAKTEITVVNMVVIDICPAVRFSIALPFSKPSVL
jgi:hypothetical protein